MRHFILHVFIIFLCYNSLQSQEMNSSYWLKSNFNLYEIDPDDVTRKIIMKEGINIHHTTYFSDDGDFHIKKNDGAENNDPRLVFHSGEVLAEDFYVDNGSMLLWGDGFVVIRNLCNKKLNDSFMLINLSSGIKKDFELPMVDYIGQSGNTKYFFTIRVNNDYSVPGLKYRDVIQIDSSGYSIKKVSYDKEFLKQLKNLHISDSLKRSIKRRFRNDVKLMNKSSRQFSISKQPFFTMYSAKMKVFSIKSRESGCYDYHFLTEDTIFFSKESQYYFVPGISFFSEDYTILAGATNSLSISLPRKLFLIQGDSISELITITDSLQKSPYRVYPIWIEQIIGINDLILVKLNLQLKDNDFSKVLVYDLLRRDFIKSAGINILKE